MIVTEELLPIKKIEDYPIVENNIHESIYQCYHILEHVRIMLSRGDSSTTIQGFIQHFDKIPEVTIS